MSTVQICATFPPNYNGLYQSVRNSVMELFNPITLPFPPNPYPPFNLTIPPLSTIPSFPPAGPSFGSPTMRIEQFISEMTSRGILMFFDLIIGTIKTISGIDVPIPTVFGIKLTDFFTKTFEELAAMYTGPTIQGMSLTFSSHLEDVRRTIQALASGEYLRLLFKELTQVLAAIKNALPPNPVVVPTLPTVPTRDEVLAMLYAQIAPRTQITMDDLFNLSVPGFPELDVAALFPNPISPFSKVGGYDIEQGLKLIMSQLVIIPLLTVLEFLAALGISVSLTPFCLLMELLPA